MHGKIRKRIYAPERLAQHIIREMKEFNFETKVKAMEHIANELDNIVRRRRNKLR